MPSHPRLPARHSATRTTHPRLRAALLCLLAVVLFVTSFAGLVYRDLQSQVTRVDVSAMVGTTRPTRAKATSIPDDYAGVAVNILVMGTDSRQGDNSSMDGPGGGEGVSGARSDTTMIMHVSADRSRIEVVSIPRDTMLPIPSCTRADGATIPAQRYAQFNSAFANAAGDASDTAAIAAGAACTLKTVEQLTNVHIDEFVVVDFAGLQRMIDALGGVKVYVDEPIDDRYYTRLQLDEGCQTLDGYQGVLYARARHGVGDGSDLSRIARQQNLMGSMLRTAQNKDLLTDADELYSFARQSLSTLTTSERIGSLTTLAGLAQSLKRIGMDNVHFVTMPNASDPRDLNRVIPAARAQAVWEALINDQPIPTDEASVDANGATIAPSEDAAATGTTDTGTTTTDSGSAASQSGTAGSGTQPTELSPREQCYAS